MKLSDAAESGLRALTTALPSREGEVLTAWLSTFYAYQREWLLDFARFSLVNKARQIGASHTYAAQASMWGAFLGETTTVISVGEREALEVADKAKRHARVLTSLGSKMARTARVSAQEVRFRGGGRVLALPNSSGGRSYSGNVMLDEVAYYQRPELTWDGAAAVVMHGYRLRGFSTPNGVGNFWHDTWTKAESLGYRTHEITIDRARADGLRVAEDELWKMARGDPRLYDQLFRCKFLDGVNQLIPAAAIEACTADSTFRAPGDGECFAGLDLGRSADRTELVVVRVVPDMVNGEPYPRAYVQHVETCKRTDDADIDRLAALAFAPPFSCRRLAVDATGMGTFPSERLQKRYGEMRVWPVSFTLQSKEDLATTMHHAFVNDWIRIPRSDTTLRDEIASIRREVTRAGNVRFDAPQTSEGHGDRAWALALSLHAIGKVATRAERYR